MNYFHVPPFVVAQPGPVLLLEYGGFWLFCGLSLQPPEILGSVWSHRDLNTGVAMIGWMDEQVDV